MTQSSLVKSLLWISFLLAWPAHAYRLPCGVYRATGKLRWSSHGHYALMLGKVLERHASAMGSSPARGVRVVYIQVKLRVSI